MKLPGNDDLIGASIVTEEDDAILVSEQGMSIRFSMKDVTPKQRAAGGMKGMTLRKGDRVVSMDVATADGKLLVISKHGFGKLTALKNYKSQGRGGMGLKTFNITSKTGKGGGWRGRRRQQRGLRRLRAGSGAQDEPVGDIKQGADHAGSIDLQAPTWGRGFVDSLRRGPREGRRRRRSTGAQGERSK